MNDQGSMTEAEVGAMLGVLGDSIETPADGPQSILELAGVRRVASGVDDDDRVDVRRSGVARWKLIAASAAVLTLVGGTFVALTGSTGYTTRMSKLKESVVSDDFHGGGGKANEARGVRDTTLTDSSAAKSTANYYKSGPGPITTSADTVPASAGPSPLTDQPKLQKNGSVDLELRRSTLMERYDDINRIAKVNGGYLADGKTDEVGTVPRASATIRVPVARFEGTLASVTALAGKKSGNRVVSRTATSADVTAAFADVEARLRAATAERDQVSLVLSKATTIGDILAVRDRLNLVQTEVDRLQGQINVFNDQTSYASIAVSLHEKPEAGEIATEPKPETGLSKAWTDARKGFSRSIEWIVARSGKAVVLFAGIFAMLFLLKHLYPVMRRTLL